MAERANFTLDGSGEADGGGPSGASGNGGTASPNSGAIDPASLAGSAPGGTGSGEPVKRGRGRPKGSGAKHSASASPSSLDIGSVETLLFNIHGMLAVATGIEELSLAKEEANTLAKAVANVQQYYPMHISAKAMAWSNLVMVAGSVYGSRIVAVVVRKETTPPENKTSNAPNRSPFNPVVIPG